MTYELPDRLAEYLQELDDFIEAEIKPLEEEGDNARFFDHRREWARTNWEGGGLPSDDWEELLAEMRRRARAAGHYNYALPAEFGGSDGSNFDMAVIREHLAAKGLGLHCDLQSESCIVGNLPTLLMMRDFGSAEQKAQFMAAIQAGECQISFGLTEPLHGSDATWMETRAKRERRDGVEGWLINGDKMWMTGAHQSSHACIFARTSGDDGAGIGITCFLMPLDAEGFRIEQWMWTFNMPTDHPRVSLTDVWLPETALFGEEGKGLVLAQHFVHENRIRQAASSLGTARYCIEKSAEHARRRQTFGKPLAVNQGIQFPLAELHSEQVLLKEAIFNVAAQIDTMTKPEVAERLSDKVSMCNYRANRLACNAADQAIQIHGGMGYSRHTQFEHHYRHHRRYRITEGSDEIQLRKIAGQLFGFTGGKK